MSTRRYSRSPRQLLLVGGALGALLLTGAIAGAILVPRGASAEAGRLQAAEVQAERDRAALASLTPRIEAAQKRAAGEARKKSEPEPDLHTRPETKALKHAAAAPGPKRVGHAERSPRKHDGDKADQPESDPPVVTTAPPPSPPVAAPAPPPAAGPGGSEPRPDRPDRPKPSTGEFGP